ncbi:hypothetical protein GCM10007304_39580 [Rhodococcoides trifolii]|uniref:O-antigen ligase domain-containing protein n=1 Tax=Rhodococcoides trifolii TaxID=908250 RepID=A0A917G3W2_9NOCA|nr:O-antigen ligase family protein [Rhodococcus trifolii]GGG21827.1 hypothetical protein GCM10007304_39580 [Rhodococcus trifolii]
MDQVFDGLTTVGVLGAGLTGMFVLVYVVSRRFAVGLAVVSFMAVSNWDIPIWPTLVYVGGLSVTVPDVFTAVFVLSALVRSPNVLSRLFSAYSLLLALLVLMLSYSLVVGISQFGLGTAVNEARAWISILGVSFWILTYPCAQQDLRAQFEKFLTLTGFGVAIVAVVHIGMYGLGNASSGVLNDNGITAIGGRPITAVQAMFISVAALLALSKWSRGLGNWHLGLFCVFGVFVLITQHRSVWVATLAGVVVIIGSIPVVRLVVLAWWACAIALVSYVAASLGGLVTIGSDLTASAQNSNTYNGRLYDWSVLIDRSIIQGIDTIMLGAPFGSGWNRIRPDGILLTYIPHNWYISSYLRVGVVGLVAFVAVLLIALVYTFIAARSRQEEVAIPLAILVYGWAYNVQWYLVPVLVFYLASAVMGKTSRVDRDAVIGGETGRLLRSSEHRYASQR